MKYIYLLIITLLPVAAYCQQVKGRVYNTEGETLPDISIRVKGSGAETKTDSQGNFIVNVPNSNNMLLFSGIGYQPLEAKALFGIDMQIHLNPDISILDEVQVIAYGTTTKRYNLGSVTTVKSEDIRKQPVTNPLAALQGRVPGLAVTSTSGLPGSNYNLQIRGQNTLNSTLASVVPIDNPLFIIDGVPFSPQNRNVNQLASVQSPGNSVVSNNPYGGFSPFNSINPSDIESIEVLRDADATAIYGSRGGNGVILITTKKGKTGKTDFQMDLSHGISSVGETMRMMNTQEYLMMRKEAIANGGLEPNLTQDSEGYAPDLLLFDPNKETDWKEYFLGNNAKNTIANLSLSGGTTNTQFRIGAGFNRNTYVYPGDFGDRRANFLVNLNHASNDKRFRIQFSSNYSYYKNNSSGNRNLLEAFKLDPNYPDLLDDNGNLVWTYRGIPLGRGGTLANPLSYLKNKYHVRNNNLTGNLQFSYEIISGLKAGASFGYNTLYTDEYSGTPKAAINPILNTQASANFGKNNFSTWIIEPQIEYQKSIHRHSFNFLVGSTLQRDINERTMITGTGYINDNLIESISTATTRNASDGFNEYKYAAMFSRLHYRFDNRYLLSLNARRDGSSRFGPGRQFGNFGSIALGWLFSEENIFKDKLQFLSYGKLRGSYGVTGSDATSDYQYLSRWQTTLYTYDGTLGYIPQNLFNPSLSWASTKKFEAALELGFVQDRIFLTTTYYKNRSEDQLVSYNLPTMTGFFNIAANWEAKVQNSGIELLLQSTNVKNGQFTWSSSFNLSIPKNKLLSFPGLESSSYLTRYVLGQSLNTVLGFKYAGVSEETGVFRFYDAEGNVTDSPRRPSSGKLNDYQNLGDLDPEFFGGFLNSFSYRNFQFDIFLEFRKQMGVNYMQQVYSYLPGSQMNLPAVLLDRWQSPGDRATHQKYSTQYTDVYNAASNFVRSDGAYSDASYIRFKTISLSYNLHNELLQRIKVKNLRIFCNAQNLFTITDYLGNDPETQSIYAVPTLKTVVLGLQLNL
ncbi:SusC/RagA family TonB-linked outer membrane protein [Olivibacter sp. 47]|uniref:TonB-dependent receptor plug n=1 Tax=Sphingobacterium sp. (strain 21) TaxID=743722 RepID=F4CF48_SPHS2|nr:SusC/RagA family TonB-linked outer membrane protein [Olivibacter sp. 47]MDM8174106.1 SusC/RagA family TonB-linked outer membrane protein [Olivibacter sp. 47]